MNLKPGCATDYLHGQMEADRYLEAHPNEKGVVIGSYYYSYLYGGVYLHRERVYTLEEILAELD